MGSVRNSFRREFRRNKYTVIAVSIFLVMAIFAGVMLKFLYPATGSPKYGNRLDGIEDVKISNSKLDDACGKVKGEKNVVKCHGNISGKIVNFIVTVEKDMSVKNAEKLADVALKNFTKKEIEFYDFQVFIKNENEGNGKYPIIGYKNTASTKFSFTKSR